MSSRSNATPNTRLKELRRARGLTQKCLADLIQVSLNTERDWEYGRIALPRIRQLKALSDTLNVPMGQLGFAALHQPVEDAIDLSSDLYEHAALSQALLIFCDDEQMKRRSFTLLTGAALVSPATQHLATPLSDPTTHDGSRMQITDELVDGLDEVNGWLRGMDDLVGGVTLLQVTRDQLHLVTDLANNGRYGERISRRLHSTLAELLRTAGWQSFDTGHPAQAQHLWLTALRAAHEAGDHALGANILGWMSDQAKEINVADAIPLAEAALQTYRGSDPKVHTLLQLQAAKAYGYSRDLTACRRAIDACFDSWGKVSQNEDAPSWTYWIDERAIHTRAAGFSYYAMGKWTQAQEHLQTALALHNPKQMRDHGLCYTMLAISQLAQRDVEQACANANKAIDLFAGRIESTQCVNYLNHFTRKLDRYRASPTARQFMEKTRGLKTTAT